MKLATAFKSFVPLFLWVSSAGAQAVPAARHDFDIEAENLPKALLIFARQAGVSVAHPPLSFHDGKAQAVKGRYSINDALNRMLADTGYRHVIVSEGAIRIEPAPKVAPAPAEGTDDGFDRPLLEEIRVSATRRSDKLIRLPYSISAVSGSRIEKRGAVRTQDISLETPGTIVTNRRPGESKVVLRGLSDGAFSGRIQSLVSTYLDYARLTYNAPDPDIMLYDVDRVEVLRGPQGTLYGSGSLGGLYRVVSNEPSASETLFAGHSSLSTTRYGDPSVSASTVANIPLVKDKAGLRALAYYRHDGGFIDDSSLKLDDINSHRTVGGRLGVSLKPFESAQLIFSARHQKHNADDTGYANADLGKLKRDNYLQEPRRDRFNQFEATVRADLGWAELVSSASWLNRRISAISDASTIIPTILGLEAVASPFSMNRHIKSFTNETHLASARGSRFEWLIGTFYSSRSEQSLSDLTVPGAGDFAYFSGNDVIYEENLRDRLKEYAVFGEATYYVTRDLFLTAGLRAFHYNDKAVSTVRDIGLQNSYDVDGAQKKTGITPKFVIAYIPSENHLLYAQIAQGYRVGGINLAGFTSVEDIGLLNETGTTTPNLPDIAERLENFASDDLTSLEFGWKAKLWGDRLTLYSAAFYSSWKKIQSYQYGYNGLPEIDNVGNARIFGLEGEAQLRVGAHTSLRTNFSWTKSEITKTSNRFGAKLGDPLPGAPTLSAGAQLEHNFSLFSNAASLSFAYSFTGSTNLMFERSERYRTDASHRIDSRLSILRGPWEFSLFVHNLLNNDANVFAYGNPFKKSFLNDVVIPAGEESGGAKPGEDPTTPGQFSVPFHQTPLRPRTIGIEVSWKF